MSSKKKKMRRCCEIIQLVISTALIIADIILYVQLADTIRALVVNENSEDGFLGLGGKDGVVFGTSLCYRSHLPHQDCCSPCCSQNQAGCFCTVFSANFAARQLNPDFNLLVIILGLEAAVLLLDVVGIFFRKVPKGSFLLGLSAMVQIFAFMIALVLLTSVKHLEEGLPPVHPSLSPFSEGTITSVVKVGPNLNDNQRLVPDKGFLCTGLNCTILAPGMLSLEVESVNNTGTELEGLLECLACQGWHQLPWDHRFPYPRYNKMFDKTARLQDYSNLRAQLINQFSDLIAVDLAGIVEWFCFAIGLVLCLSNNQ